MTYTATEKAILDLSDAGLSPKQISKHGFAPNRVRFVLSTFGTRERDQAATKLHRRKMAAASHALLVAIVQARPA